MTNSSLSIRSSGFPFLWNFTGTFIPKFQNVRQTPLIGSKKAKNAVICKHFGVTCIFRMVFLRTSTIQNHLNLSYLLSPYLILLLRMSLENFTYTFKELFFVEWFI